MASRVYNLMKRIMKGEYDKKDMQEKLDVFLTYNRITLEEYEELAKEMNGTTEE